MPNPPIYRVKGWNDLYENNRTRDMKVMAWVPLSNRHDGDGYTDLVERKNGAALFGAWVAVVQVASRCGPRGTLLRDTKTPHDAGSLSRMTRIPATIIQEMLDICTRDCKWLEIIESHEGAEIPQEGASIPHPTDEEGKERKNGMEGKESSMSGKPDEVKDNSPIWTQCRIVLHYLNEKSGRHYREVAGNLTLIRQRLEEPEVTTEGVKLMIERQVKRWLGTSQAEYLRPETLFGKSKFDGYYAARELPVTTDEKPRVKADHENGF